MPVEAEARATRNVLPDPPLDVDADVPPPTTPARSRGRRGPVKLTVNLLARVVDKLEEVCGYTGESRTDAINRAIQLYALYHETTRAGGTFIIRQGDREREFHVL